MTGLCCPRCGGGTAVAQTVSSPQKVERWRKCKPCGQRFVTQEVVAEEATLPLPGKVNPENARAAKQRYLERKKAERKMAAEPEPEPQAPPPARKRIEDMKLERELQKMMEEL